MFDPASSPLHTLLLASSSGALAGMVIAAAVAHGVMQHFLEARGVSPWSARDSIGALPVVLAGAGMLGAAFALMVVAIPEQDAAIPVAGTLGVALPLAFVGAIVLRLGLLELRKLT